MSSGFLHAESLPLKDGPDAAANEGVGHPVELAVVADVTGACDFARLLMDEEEFEILRTRLAEGPNVVICRGVPRGCGGSGPLICNGSLF